MWKLFRIVAIGLIVAMIGFIVLSSASRYPSAETVAALNELRWPWRYEGGALVIEAEDRDVGVTNYVAQTAYGAFEGDPAITAVRVLTSDTRHDIPLYLLRRWMNGEITEQQLYQEAPLRQR